MVVCIMMINLSDIRRHGKTIILGQGYSATEDYSHNLPKLRIRKNGRPIQVYRGSSLYFNNQLTDDDKRYLASLVEDIEKEI